jgi:hypothetical protein
MEPAWVDVKRDHLERRGIASSLRIFSEEYLCQTELELEETHLNVMALCSSTGKQWNGLSKHADGFQL